MTGVVGAKVKCTRLWRSLDRGARSHRRLPPVTIVARELVSFRLSRGTITAPTAVISYTSMKPHVTIPRNFRSTIGDSLQEQKAVNALVTAEKYVLRGS